MPTLHIHLDESGSPKFSPQSPRYYVFAIAWTYNPSPVAAALTSLRFKLLREGHDIPGMHAQKDRKYHKESVVRIISAYGGWNWAASVIEMPKVYPEMRDPALFYSTFIKAPLRFVFRGRTGQASRVLVYTDQLQVNKDSVKKTILDTCSEELGKRNIPYHLFHHPSCSNAWLQVADYCAYAVCRKWEFNDTSLYDFLGGSLACPEMDLLRKGTYTYYTHQSLKGSN